VTETIGKDLLGLESLTGDQIRLILDTAEPFKEISERAIKKVPALRGSTIVNLFFENSTRTRISFEFAEKRLSADTVNVSASGSSVSKGGTRRRGQQNSWPTASSRMSSTPGMERTSIRHRVCSTSLLCGTDSVI